MRTIIDNSTFKNEYKIRYPWQENCFVQGGSNGFVFNKDGGYRTAYFEAFPKEEHCDTFIRGEGKTMEEAEKNAYELYLKYKNCPKHEFEKMESYSNGMGKCKHCGMKKIVFEPNYTCVACGKHEEYVDILPIFKKEKTDCLCEECSKKKENLKYITNRSLEHLCNFKNGILLCYPVLDKNTFDKLLVMPATLDELYSILDKDSNQYLEPYIKRLEMDLEDSYRYIKENYMDRWIERGYPEREA